MTSLGKTTSDGAAFTQLRPKNPNQVDIGGPERGFCLETPLSSPVYPATHPPLPGTTRAGIGPHVSDLRLYPPVVLIGSNETGVQAACR
jgi:hypothetical protein